MSLTGQRSGPRKGGWRRRRGSHNRHAESPSDASAESVRRPELAPHVVVHEPLEADAPWIVQSGQHYIRVGADMGRLLSILDGEHDHEDLVQRLGPPWTNRDVSDAVARIQRMRLLKDGRKRKAAGTWFKYTPPMTLQFTLLKPQRLLGRLVPLIRLVANPVGAVLAAVLVLGGMLALALQAPVLERSLGAPLPITVMLAVAVATFITTALHEMGHGAVLTYYGGRPSRMGFMLFYMTPAFFCDVSDGWRLPHGSQRTRIALAGIATQLVIGGAVAIAAPVIGRVGGASALYDGAVVFAASTYVAGLINLIPFVKLDGYIALMSHLDIPHLRDRAMADARHWLAGVLFGGTRTRELPRLPWAIPFGLVCMVFPLYLVGIAFTLWSDILRGLGSLGTALMIAAIGYLLYRVGSGAKRVLRESDRAGAQRWRLITVSALIAVAAGASLLFIKVPYTVVGGFVQENGRVELVLRESADVAAVQQGSEVRLQRRGIVLRTDIGTGAVADAAPEKGTAPLAAFLPAQEVDDLPVPVRSFPLRTTTTPAEDVGMAHVQVGERPLGEWLVLNYVAPAWR